MLGPRAGVGRGLVPRRPAAARAGTAAVRRRPSGDVYFFPALPVGTTTISSTVVAGRRFTSLRVMNRPVTASRATFFPTVWGFLAIVLAPLSKWTWTGNALLREALSVRGARGVSGRPVPPPKAIRVSDRRILALLKAEDRGECRVQGSTGVAMGKVGRLAHTKDLPDSRSVVL